MREAAAPERQLKRSLTALDLTVSRDRRDHWRRHFRTCRHRCGRRGRTSGRLVVKTPLLNFLEALDDHSDLAFGRPRRGPRSCFRLSWPLIACGFAALCYAELAAMIPVSGSAYTYSYATLGEIVAWIIGWDLILEYAVGNMAVAIGWSGYFVKLCGSLFGIKFPLWRD